LQAETLSEQWVTPWEGGVWSPPFFVCLGLFFVTNWLIERQEAAKPNERQ